MKMRHSNPVRRFLLLALTAAMVLTMIIIPASAATYRQGDRGQRCDHDPDQAEKLGVL